MSHRPRKRAKSVAEPTPALEPTPTTTSPAANTSGAPTPSQKPAPHDHLVVELVPYILKMVETLMRTAVSAANLEPHMPRHTFTIFTLQIRKHLTDSVDILDKCIDASQPGRTFSCLKYCPLKTNPPPSAPKPVDHKSIATDAPVPPTPPPPVSNPSPATVTKSYAD
ncbi:hypothetical protein FRC12_019290, partial [Ceratobasidium sp. 428]